MKVGFAEFTLDSEARQLICAGRGEIRLSPKAFDLLRLLIEHRPKVLTKAYLQGQIWPDTFVVDANLTVLIAEIRRGLADHPRDPRFIRTAHAVGYAFCGDALDLARPSSRPANGRPARCWLVWNERAIVLADGENIVGRDPACAVWLDAPGVSRRHACIQVVRNDAVFLEDLRSKNGTVVNGSRIDTRVRVPDGTVIHVGSIELTLRIWSEGKSPETERIRRNRPR